MSNNWSNSIWLVIDSLTFGGIETHLFEIAKGLKQANIDLQVWFIRQYSQPALLATKLEQAGISVNYLDCDNTSYLNCLVKQVRLHRPALLHAHGYKASLTCKLARLITGVRQISTYHAGETPTGRVWLYDFIDRMSASISSESIAVSDAIGAKLLGKSECFNNFVDTHHLELSQGKQIAFVGRLSQEKAPDRYLDLARHNPGLEFQVFGSGPLEHQLSADTPDNVLFHGHQNSMDPIWPKIAVLVICSRYEGLPMTALEAMARGIVVISLNVGNMAHLIEPNSNGYLSEDMQELNTALHHYLTLSKAQQSAIKQRAIHTIEQDFSQSAVIPKLLKLYFPAGYQTDCQIEK